MAWFDTSRPKSGVIRREKTVVFDEQSPAAKETRAFDFAAPNSAELSQEMSGPISEVRVEVIQEPALYTESDIARAREEGFEAGCLASSAEDQELRDKMEHAWAEQFEQVTDTFYQWRHERIGQMQEALLRMTELLARSVLSDHFDQVPQSYVELATQLVERAVGFETLRLYVPPGAVAYLEREVEALERKHPDQVRIDLEADPTMSPGDCRLKVEGGMIEGDLGTRLEKMIATMRETMIAHPVLEP